MIDEKRLDELDQETCPLGVGMGSRKDQQEMYELIELARLGLWAEKHAIPALQSTETHLRGEPECKVVMALSALPKETT